MHKELSLQMADRVADVMYAAGCRRCYEISCNPMDITGARDSDGLHSDDICL